MKVQNYDSSKLVVTLWRAGHRPTKKRGKKNKSENNWNVLRPVGPSRPCRTQRPPATMEGRAVASSAGEISTTTETISDWALFKGETMSGDRFGVVRITTAVVRVLIHRCFLSLSSPLKTLCLKSGGGSSLLGSDVGSFAGGSCMLLTRSSMHSSLTPPSLAVQARWLRSLSQGLVYSW